MRGRWMVAIDSTFLGDGDDAEKLLAPIRAVAEPLLDGVGEVPLDKVTEIAQEPDYEPALQALKAAAGS